MERGSRNIIKLENRIHLPNGYGLCGMIPLCVWLCTYTHSLFIQACTYIANIEQRNIIAHTLVSIIGYYHRKSACEKCTYDEGRMSRVQWGDNSLKWDLIKETHNELSKVFTDSFKGLSNHREG